MEELIKLHSEAKKYVVYAHYYEDQLFYIGSGIYRGDNTSKSRAYDFINRGPDWFDYCDGETEKIEVELLFQTNDRKLAFDKEGELTKTYIEKGYKLVNKSFGAYHSAETRNKMSLAKKGENHHMYGKRGKGTPMYGKKHTKETRERISEAHKGKNLSDETRELISKNNARSKKVLAINNESRGTKVFDSVKDAYEFISQNGFDKTKVTLHSYLNKGPYNFKNYTIELTK